MPKVTAEIVPFAVPVGKSFPPPSLQAPSSGKAHCVETTLLLYDCQRARLDVIGQKGPRINGLLVAALHFTPLSGEFWGQIGLGTAQQIVSH
jgi:hypothetical protein